MQLSIKSYSWKFETRIAITFLFIQMVHRMGIMWLVQQLFGFFPSDTVISMRLLDDLASIFTAGFWAIIKSLKKR